MNHSSFIQFVVVIAYCQCWGHDRKGQVSGVPVGVVFKLVAAGSFHSCGLRELDSTVECWGDTVVRQYTSMGYV
jgi:hypothetical protein